MKQLTRLVLMLGATLFFVATPAYAEVSGQTNYWSFDDATGRSVGDTGGQNGVLTGSSTGLGWASGKAGTALAMGGTTGEGVALPNGFLTGSAGTISVWFKLDEMTDRNVIFSSKSTTDNYIYSALVIEREGRPQFQYRTDAAATDRRAQVTKVLNKGEWYHIVFVATGQTYKAFVNGEEQTIAGDNVGRWFPDITNHTLSYRIGVSEAAPILGSLAGMIDELRIYNRALSADEVTTLYNQGNEGTPTVPLAIRPELTFSISADTVLADGAVTLEWKGLKVDTCTASDAWSGSVETSGARLFSKLTTDQTYTLTCGGKGGSVTKSVYVRVGTSTTNTTGGTLVVEDITPAKPATPPTTVAPAQAFSQSLTVGSRSDEVKRMQMVLVMNGFLANEHATGYFGALTKAALMKFQTKHGITATGYFGPMTMAKMNALPTDGTTNTLTVPSATATVNKEAKIAELLMLIAELQKALSAMKAGTTY